MSDSEKIPKVVHQTYASTEDLSQKIIQKNVLLENLNHDYIFEYYDNERMENWMRENSTDSQFQIFSSINPKYGAARADFFRYILIYKVGGIYLDIKSTSLVPFRQIINSADEFLISKWQRNSENGLRLFGQHKELLELDIDEYQQWFLISKPNHPAFAEIINTVSERILNLSVFKRGKFGRLGVLELTGPIIFTKVVVNFLNLGNIREIDSYAEGLRYKTLSQGEELVYRNSSAPHYSEIFEPIVLHKFKIIDRFYTFLNVVLLQWCQQLNLRYFFIYRKLYKKLLEARVNES